METVIFRLRKGTDLRRGIEEQAKGLPGGALVAAVGCVDKARIRLAGAREYRELSGSYEIVALSGTVCAQGAHLHIALADSSGQVVGGHLCYGTLVDTTAEIVFYPLAGYELGREPDPATGYRELTIKKRG